MRPRVFLIWLLLSMAATMVLRMLIERVLAYDSPAICIAAALGLSTQLMGLGIAMRHKSTGSDRPEPTAGERLWMCDALALCPRLVVWSLTALNVDDVFGMTWALQSLVALGTAWLYFRERRNVVEPVWRVVFAMNAATQLALACAGALSATRIVSAEPAWSACFLLYSLQLLANFIGIVTDLVSVGPSKPWTHWVGALLPWWNALVILAAAIVYVATHA
jgi:hypothetical protein